jgi:DivIVA domain-containing protein
MERLTPKDIFNKDFPRERKGYSRQAVDEFLDLVIQSYEEVLQENERLKEELEGVKAQAVNREVIDDIMRRLERLESMV